MFTKSLLISFIIFAWGISPGFCSFKNRTYQEVLDTKYKNCKLKKENIFLTKKQVATVRKVLDVKISALLLRYQNSCDNSVAYVDSHIVRTLNETVIIEIKDKKINWIEIASFMEPREYIPPKKWLNLLKDKRSNVDSLTGATISENALKRLVQKYIVINNLLNEKN